MTQEALKLALEALEKNTKHLPADFDYHFEAITAIEKALAQTQEPVQKPVAVVSSCTGVGDKGVRVKWLGGFPQIGDRLYFHPPQRTEQPAQSKPLTDDLYNELLCAVENKYPDETRHQTALHYIKQAEMPSARPAQAAHGIKENT